MATLKKRWLLIPAYLFQLVIPLIIIIELMNIHKAPKMPAFLLVLGIAYICFALRVVREKLKKLKEGTFKVFVQEINFLVPFFVVAVLVYITENLFNGFYKWCLCIVGCIAFGSLLKIIEYEINKKYIYKKRIESLAQEQVDLEKAKNYLTSSLDD